MGSLRGPPRSWGFLCVSAPDASSSPPGAPADASLWRQCGVSSCFYALQCRPGPVTPSAWSPRGAPAFRVPPSCTFHFGVPCLEGCLPLPSPHGDLSPSFRFRRRAGPQGPTGRGAPCVFPCETLPLLGALSRHRHRPSPDPVCIFTELSSWSAWMPPADSTVRDTARAVCIH